MASKVIAAINVGYGLVKAGMEIFALIKDKGDLTNADLQSIIDKQNEAQEKARSELSALLED